MAIVKMAMPTPDAGVCTNQDGEARSVIRSLHVIAGSLHGSSMIFAKRQATSLRYADVAVHQFFLRSRTSPVCVVQEFFRLRREIRDFKPEIIHAQYGTVTGLLSGLATTRPLVVTFRGSDLNPIATVGRFRSVLGRFFSQLAALRASQIICVTSALKDRLWWRRDRVTVLWGGIDMALFCPRPQREARAQLGWPVSEKVVLFNAGRSPEIKRLDIAQAAIEEANRLGCAVRLEVLNGSTDPSEIPLYLNAADCLLITSDSEGSPYIVKEALSCELPIVSVDVGDVAETLAGVSPSRIVPREVRALGSTLVGILSQRCRSNGRAAMQEFSEAKTSEKIRSIYERVLSSDRATKRRGLDAFGEKPEPGQACGRRRLPTGEGKRAHT